MNYKKDGLNFPGKMRNKLLYIILTVCLKITAQQDPQYSQYMFNQVVINPAYAGSREALSATMLLRKQWVSMPGSPQTNSVSLHGPLKRKTLGLGGHMVYETIGPKKWMAAYADYAYRFRLGKGKMSLGLSTGFINYTFDFASITYKDPGEVISNSDFGPKTKFDVNTGIYYYTNSFYMGLSTSHVNKPKLYNLSIQPDNSNNVYNFNFNLNRHYFFTISKAFLINENLVFNPSLLTKTVGLKSSLSMDVNLNFFIKKRLWLGTSLRSSKNLIFLTQFFVTDKFRIGYSFDYGFGNLGREGHGSHEIMVGYDFSIFKSRMVSPRYL